MQQAEIHPSLARKPFGCALTTYARLRKKIILAALQGQPITVATTPDCGTCTACCRFDLNEAKKGDDLSLFVEQGVQNRVRWVLPRQENGDCAYLEHAACTVYQRRPSMCRIFDCRDYVATGVMPGSTSKVFEASTQWDLRTALRRPDDWQTYLALRLATQESIRGGKTSAEEIAGTSLLYCDNYLPSSRRIYGKLTSMAPEDRLNAIEVLAGRA
jgi:hypothetical protein